MSVHSGRAAGSQRVPAHSSTRLGRQPAGLVRPVGGLAARPRECAEVLVGGVHLHAGRPGNCSANLVQLRARWFITAARPGKRSRRQGPFACTLATGTLNSRIDVLAGVSRLLCCGCRLAISCSRHRACSGSRLARLPWQSDPGEDHRADRCGEESIKESVKS